MTGSRDYRDEMYAQRELDDATVEAVLRGGPVPAELESLAAALASLRTLPGQPVRPSAELAARMATGDFASAVAPRPSRRSAGQHASRRRLAVLPLRVKVAAGSVLALGGLATATVAGALPEPARQGVQSVIEAVTPFEFADTDDFGKDVSDDARDGGVDGQEISEDTQQQGNRNGRPQPSDVRPTETSQPDTRTLPPDARPTEHPGDTRPSEQGKPAHAGTPNNSGQPAQAGNPNNSNQSAQTGNPNNRGRPDQTGKPESAGQSDGLPVDPGSTG